MITNRGRELARQIERHIGAPTLETLDTLSLIARHATTHNRLQEIACSVEMSERQQARHDKRDSQIEARITALVATLPRTVDGGTITVKFGGDPRGYTVKLVIPGRPHDGNTWGLGGEYGV